MIKIIKCSKKDIPRILELARNFIEEYRIIAKIKPKVSVDSALKFKKGIFEKDFKSGKGVVFAVEMDGRYVGYIFVLTFMPGMEKANKHSPAYISDLHIEKPFRGKGFAMKLIKEAEKWAKSKNKQEISLDVGTFNGAAIELYKKSDFKEKSIKLEKKLK
jgi:ribosomal protein S18 acetylase RimI-like enzyme